MRRKKEGASVSLMPILSIQKCAMGVMVVIVCAQTLTSIGKTADLYMEVAQAGAGQREPVYVECRQAGVLIHPEKTSVAQDALEGQSEFSQLLADMQGKRNEKYVVFLIRPDGVATYDKCLNVMKKQNPPLQFGKDALLAGGDLVLTKEGKPIAVMKK